MDAVRIGRARRALRVRRRLTQTELAGASDIDRSKISRIERGRIERVPFGDLVALARALDARLDLDLSWRGAALDRLVDARHAATVAATVNWLTAAGWTCFTEVSFSIYGERGSIDVVGVHPSGALAAVEVKATIGDANQTLIGVDRKGRLMPQVARERGWRRGPVGVLLVVADTSTSRRRIAQHDGVFRAALPATAAVCRRWVRTPEGSPPRGIVFIQASDSHRVRTK